MDRPFLRWLLFALCLALFVGAMAWITSRALSLDRQFRETSAEAMKRERIRLALWRMETEASAIFVRESARPSHHYQPFLPVDSLDTGIVQVPSPLLGRTPDLVKLHFECSTSSGARNLCSPQIPVGPERDRALQRYSIDTPSVQTVAKMEELRTMLDTNRSWESVAGFGFPQISGKTGIGQLTLHPETAPEWAFRELKWRDDTLVKKPIQEQVDAGRTPSKKTASGAPPETAEPQVGEMRALWLGNELVFVRSVAGGGVAPRMQGVWMDWPRLNARLVDAARDLLPGAALEPVARNGARADDWMALVTLPVRLVPGEVPLSVAATASGLKTALLLAWVCLGVAALSIGIVLHRTTQLSERRAAFVSAVTHELRTPLTTFRLYSEMLAGGAVPDEEQRGHYLRTLHRESDRLTHLVENLLSYSRIERGRPAPRLESIGVPDLVESALGRVRERCEAAGLALTVNLSEAAARASVKADAGVVEQILFNLADNAAKYAAPDSDPTELVLDVRAEDDAIDFILRDFGDGLSPARQRSLFRPFGKSATEAAHSAPGIGLGLSLCRRLAREMGGDLRFVEPAGRGASFVLRLAAAAGS